MSPPITLTATAAPLRVASLRILHPYTGVWLADIELDPDDLALAPTSGPVTITIGSPPIATLRGTIDPRGSGSFVEVAYLRVLGGGAGWDKTVVPQHFHSDAGVLSTAVIAATALLVGEVASVILPSVLGIDFVRSAGPASRVLEGMQWWLDLLGITQVGPRLPAIQDFSTTVIRWDPEMQLAELTCDALVIPGTLLLDPRLPVAGVIVRDVEQTFDGRGSTVKAWCGVSPSSQLMGDFRSLVEEFSGRKFLQTYLYRIVLQNSADGRIQLQALTPSEGVPDTLPLSPWTGLSGASAKYLLGSTVRVSFVGGDPSQPIVDSYAPGVLPLQSTVDASLAVNVGPSAPLVALGGGTVPLVLAPPYAGLLTALATFAAALEGVAVGPLSPLQAPANALQTALGLLPPAATTKVVGV